MSLIIATGSNLGHSIHHLQTAQKELCRHYHLIAASRIFRSIAVDYLEQPDFFNQVLEFSLPRMSPEKVMEQLLQIEFSMGRRRDIPRGPRTIDLDMIFWSLETHHANTLILPHPRWLDRSFVVRPLQELPFFKTIEKCFTIPLSFEVEAFPV